MTQTKISFRYSESNDFQPPFELRMDVPERSLSEMCEYFQRFLQACGYFFDEGESVGIVRKEKEEEEKPLPSSQGDIIITDDGTMQVRDSFGWVAVHPDTARRRISGFDED